MKILALDTSGSNLSVCVREDEKKISDFNLAAGVTHSETLLPVIDTLFQNLNMDLNEIDVFSCGIGPGSFTGLRIGIATVKGFALSLQKKVIGIPTLLALAENIPHFDGIICSVLDAKNKNVYAGLYEKENGMLAQIDGYITESVDVLIDRLKAKEKKVIFVGDGIFTYREMFEKALGEKAFFASLSQNRVLASSVAKLAYDRAIQNDFDNIDTLNPLYLKKSQAERMLEMGENTNE